MSLWKKISAGCAALSPNCREAVRAQSDALQGPLPLARRLGLRLHLLVCQWCRRYGHQIRFLRSAAHDHEEPFTAAGPEQLSAAARERIKQRLQKER